MSTILVVGCGPTGLTVAAVLKSYGIDVTLIDKYPGVLKATKAAAIHARTIEVLEIIGCADRIVEEGQKVEYLNLRTHYEDRLIVKFADLPDTKYPFMIDLPQYRTEEILIDRARELGVELRRSVELKDLVLHDHSVTVTLQAKDDDGKTDKGAPETRDFDYVIGCDGVHSIVRSKIGQDFAGESYADPWCLTDARMEWPIPRNEMTFSSDATGICGMFPLPEEGHFRVVYTQWFDDDGKPIPPDRENMIRAIARTGEKPPVVHEIGKFWTFNLDHRQVDHYRRGRVFLVGDAAHVHTPFGGQGMNLGICDAQNLAWKLAAVVNGLAGESLLGSYHDERHPIAKDVIKLTHLGASAMLVRKGATAALRDWSFSLLNLPDAFRDRMAERLSQLAHTYRSPHLLGEKVGAGDRLPNVLFYDGYASRKHRLHDRIKPGVLNLILAVAGLHQANVDVAVAAMEEVKRRSPVPLRVSVYSRFPIEGRERFAAVDDWAYDRKAELDPAITYDSRCFLVRPDSFVGDRRLDADVTEILQAIDKTYRRVGGGVRATAAAE